MGVHEYHSTLPLVFTPACACSNGCCNSLSLSSYHLPVLDPLVDSLVACQRLTSLGLTIVNLSLQSLLAVVKGLHNLRALRLEKVSLSDERVSPCVT